MILRKSSRIATLSSQDITEMDDKHIMNRVARNASELLKGVLWSLIFIGVFFGAVFFVSKVLVPDTRPPTRDELEYAEKIKFLCHLKEICSLYSAERLNCATAGNYNVCMSIRVKPNLLNLAEDVCSEDGAISNLAEPLPSSIKCFLYSASPRKK
jgi:hypothetical protein